MNRCTLASHDVLRANPDLFVAATQGGYVWGGLLYVANCRACQSTICIYLCAICSAPCPSTDALPFGDEDTDAHAHFGCVARRVLSKNKGTKFVIVAGKKTAREFTRETT